MPQGTLSARVRLDGEKEYKDAIKEINAGIGVLNSELKRNAAEFKDNADSVEALTAKNDILERTLSSQREKVEKLRRALAYSAQEYGEADSRTTSWARQLNEAEAAVFDTEAAIRANNEAMRKNQETGVGLGSVLDSISEKLGIDIPDGVTRSVDGFGSFDVKSVAAFGAAAAAVKLVIDAVNELTDITQEAAAKVDDIVTASTKTGIDTYTMQVLDYMEDLADVDMSTVTGDMAKLTKSMSDAADGSETAQKAFATLGVSITEDGHLREATDVFWEAIDALGQIESNTQRDAVAMDIFGRKAQELNTLIAVGSDGFRRFADEAESVGYILGEKDLKALNDYQDALDRAQKTQEAMQQQMAAKMAPGLEELTEGWSNLKSEGLQLIIDSGIIDFLADLCTVIGKVVGFAGDMLEALNMLLHPIDTLKDLLGIQNETLEENAAMSAAATDANESFKNSVSGDASVLNNTATAANNATNSLRQYAIEAGYAENISEKRLQELGAYSQANGSRGAGFFGNFADMSNADFKTLLDQNGITSSSMISAILGEDAYRFYQASAYHNSSGDYNFVGGLTRVGENGPENVFLPQGSRIMSAQESRNTGGDIYNITIDAKNVKELNDIIQIVRYSRVTSRMGAKS